MKVMRAGLEAGNSFMEELAESASINLRTLQRIEKGETEPRGQTLRLIAQALDTPLEDFLDFTKEDDQEFLQLLNLSTLAFWVIPLGNIFIPLVLWIMKKDKVKGAGELGRRIINFQITWSFCTFGLLFICLIGEIMHLPMPALSSFYMMIGVGILYLINSILIIIASFQIHRGSEKIYFLGLKIIS